MSVNKVILIGRVGKQPEFKSFDNGGEIANFTLATSERWNDKKSGERQEKTEWHNITIRLPALVSVCKNYIHKGSQIFIDGKIQTRKYQKDGSDRYVTEIIGMSIQLLGSKSESKEEDYKKHESNYEPAAGNPDKIHKSSKDDLTGGESTDFDLDDEIPF